MNERDLALSKVEMARKNLLLMIALTLVNLVLLALGSGVFMLFSATVPYYAVAIGIEAGIQEFMTFAIVVAAISLLLYFLCWLFSKKSYGWLIAALVLFILDTICLILLSIAFGDFSGILDFVIHAIVIYYLIVGVKYGSKLKKLPEATLQTESVFTGYTQAEPVQTEVNDNDSQF